MILIPMVVLAVMLVGVNGFLAKMALRQNDVEMPSYQPDGTISSSWPSSTRANAPNGGDASENQRLLDFDSEDMKESDNSAYGSDEQTATVHDPDTTEVK